MSPHKQHAAVWLAFSAGMYADAVENAGRHTDEQIDPDDAETMFLVANSSALDALGVDHDQAMVTFNKGRVFMRELRSKGIEALPKPEDGPPLLASVPSAYTGPERQLPGKPDGRLS